MQAELTLHQIVEGISTPVAVRTPDGAVEFVNRQVLATSARRSQN